MDFAESLSLTYLVAATGFETENKFPREDRYTWRHNNVLHMLSMAIQDQMGVVKKFPEKKAADLLIRFVRAGTSVSKLSAPKLRGILGQARDWECDFDLPEFRSPHAKYIFPQDVCATPLKMDGFVISRKHRICWYRINRPNGAQHL